MDYQPNEIEKKWQRFWKENNTYQVTHLSDKPKFYVLDMFPYPSGSGLHVGHPLGYIASDIFARYKRHKGFNVLHTMGYDAFGLPAEQYAVQTGTHPEKSTLKNIQRYREQLDTLGFCYDWSREISTCDPSYYKWTQWVFLQLYQHYYDKNEDKALPISELVKAFEKCGNAGVNANCSQDSTFSAQQWHAFSAKEKDDLLMNYRLAYRKVMYVNWCEELGTVLANDEVKDGLSERGGYPVVKKPMLQWSLRTTAYAHRLLNGLETVDWPEALKSMQRNWIGRSEGARVFFSLEGNDEKIEIFTTRPDTIFGATFMVLAPEHELVAAITTPAQQQEIDDYLQYVQSRSERDRMAEVKKVTGAFTGAYAHNPFTNKKIPVWISEYVLKDYGTGAIMAVPSDDERDQRFAEHFGLEIIDVVDKSKYPNATLHDKLGIMINSDFVTGMEVPDAIEAVIQRIEQMGIGKREINYKIRDANFSRQRYWGEPFPIVYDAEGVSHPLPVEELPLELPYLQDFQPVSGKAPLEKAVGWVNLPNGWVRETDTMPGFAGSSWYFLRYMDAHNDRAFASKEAIDYWRDVDFYIGGAEHAVGHLLYSRTWHKFLKDLGLVPTEEPFKKLVNQGMIQGIIEYVFVKKEKENGHSSIVSAEMVENEDDYIKIPIKIDLVTGYGSPDSYLDLEGIKKLLAWMPDYESAAVVCKNGVYQNGQVSDKQGELRLQTQSEVGKMGKRYHNAVNPDDVAAEYGADCFRMYEMFLGPIEQSKPWDTKGIDGVSKFLRRFWGMFFDANGLFSVSDAPPSAEELKILHTAIKKVNDDIERLSFNTCVSGFMVAARDLSKANCNKRAVLEPLVVLIAPFAPHIAEELWHLLGHDSTVMDAPYPIYEEKYLKEDAYQYPVQIGKKVRAKVAFPTNADVKVIQQAVLEDSEVSRWLEGETVKKVIVVPNKLINIVV
jgi:leucyl-tRNA synthetase